MHKRHKVTTDYLQDVFNVSNFAIMIERLIPAAKQMRREVPFDSIAFTGTSGSAVAYILSAELHVPLICIRKESENSHYSRDNGVYEGTVDAKRYIIVDDFISSGSTVKKIEEAIRAKLAAKAECVGYLMYTSSREKYDHRGRPVWTLANQQCWEQRLLPFYG